MRVVRGVAESSLELVGSRCRHPARTARCDWVHRGGAEVCGGRPRACGMHADRQDGKHQRERDHAREPSGGASPRRSTHEPFDLRERGVPRSTMSITASGAPLRLSPSAPRVRSLSSAPWVDFRRTGSFLPNQSLRSVPSPVWGTHRSEGVILQVHESRGQGTPTCTFSLIGHVFPIRGYVAGPAAMPYGRRPTVSEPAVPSVRNRTERPCKG